ncbi:MAG: phosphatase PAP2 family protein [Ginsengibacter sp.]
MIAKLYKENRLFFLLFLLFVLVAAFILLFFSKADGFIFLNPYHSTFLDWFFIFSTYLGDGLFCVALGLLFFLFKKKYLGLMVISSYLLSGFVAQVLKYFILEARPAVFFEKIKYDNFITDVTLHNYHSFPSGHTASAFALAAILSFSVKNKFYSLLFLGIAILVGYSRIYLGQHFLDDVLAGAVVGVVSEIFCWIFFSKIFLHVLNKATFKK